MLFNSYAFLIFFLPSVAILFFVLARYASARMAAAWLGLASIVFYAYWSPRYVVLLLASIIVNYVFGLLLQRTQAAGATRLAKVILVAAISVNLLTLGYFKYFNFFLDSLSHLGLGAGSMYQIILPIGISFFTFTQIAYLVDTYQGKVRESRFLPYLLFVTYFPHLVAGPILHHAEMMPQFAQKNTYRFDLSNFSLGITIFAAGLFKKVVLADGIQPFVGPVFDSGASGGLSAIEAWGGALAYTLQLYFDFSGYSDMAIGLSKMFNVDLPLNFNSPYKAKNIVEFWRRWHMTLSRFLRDYLYIPLGGNRLGSGRRYFNLAATMVLGGLWHGAAWTFVIWGALHGLYLVINHGWHALRRKYFSAPSGAGSMLGGALACLITFIAVVYAWVFFRATSVDVAWNLVAAMSGVNGWLPTPESRVWASDNQSGSILNSFTTLYFSGARQTLWIAVLLGIAWLLPNSQEAGVQLNRWLSATRGRLVRHGLLLGSVFTLIILLAIVNGGRGASEFIYFNF